MNVPASASTIQSWLLTLACSREDAERITQTMPEFDDLPSPPVLVTSEPDPANPDVWRLDAYFDAKPSAGTMRRVATLVSRARAEKLAVIPVLDQDWLSLSQSGFEPLVAGRFHVHTPNQAARTDLIDFVIPAGLAFGTGQHATTAGCLTELDRLKRGGKVYRNVLDLGTGTGLLAFAAARLWRCANVTASDIDPISITVVRENALINRVRGVRLVAADGLAHRNLVARAPYDLVIANILAQPLIDMAPAIAASVAIGGTLMLAGLLDTQAERVSHAFRREGMRRTHATAGEWPVLVLASRSRPGRRS